jgi:hypothetical protein
LSLDQLLSLFNRLVTKGDADRCFCVFSELVGGVSKNQLTLSNVGISNDNNWIRGDGFSGSEGKRKTQRDGAKKKKKGKKLEADKKKRRKKFLGCATDP